MLFLVLHKLVCWVTEITLIYQCQYCMFPCFVENWWTPKGKVYVEDAFCGHKQTILPSFIFWSNLEYLRVTRDMSECYEDRQLNFSFLLDFGGAF